MVEVLSCIEYERVLVVEQRKDNQQALTSQQVYQLENNSQLPAHLFYLTVEKGKTYLIWQQFCGVIQLSDLTIEVLPKIHDKQSLNDCRHLLLKMLHKTQQL